MNIRARLVFGGIIAFVFHHALVRGAEVRRTAEERGDFFRQAVEYDGRSGTRGVGFVEFVKFFVVGVIVKHAVHALFEFRGFRRVRCFIRGEKFVPFLFGFFAFRNCAAGMAEHAFGNGKRFFRPAQRFFQRFEIFRAERRAVAVGFSRKGGAVADNRFADDEAGFFLFRLRFFDGAAQRGKVVDVVYLNDLPAERFVAFAHVLGERRTRVALYGDVVGIVKHDEFSELVRSRKGGGFVFDSLLQAAVAAQYVSVVIGQGKIFLVEFRRHFRFGKRHAHRRGDTLSQGSRGSFHARGHAVFGMSRRFRAELAEIFDVFDAHVEAEQI